jgi:hypothetical protein
MLSDLTIITSTYEFVSYNMGHLLVMYVAEETTTACQLKLEQTIFVSWFGQTIP